MQDKARENVGLFCLFINVDLTVTLLRLPKKNLGDLELQVIAKPLF